MRQYWEHKRQTPGAILLFRMGDFYEMFYEDAKLGARVLGITLTSRDRGRTPLAGIPHHALESYLAKLVAAGHKVAISEQIEDARQAKGVVKRAVVRIVTPGTLTDDALLDQSQSNVLAAVWTQREHYGLAALELSTGHFSVQECAASVIVNELIRLSPAEVLLPEETHAGRSPLEADIREQVGAAVTYRSVADFAPHWSEQILREQFEVSGLEGFGFDEVDASLQAAGALLAYARETQKAAVRHVQPPRRREVGEHMALDPTTLRSLEVVQPLRGGGRAGTLLAAVDETCNPMGVRLLRQWLCYPLRGHEAIRRRQRLVNCIREADAPRTGLRGALRRIGDIDRMVGRIGVQRTHPRDLRGLGDGLTRLREIREHLAALHSPDADTLAKALEDLDDLADNLCASLNAEAPTALREGGIFAPGSNAELDRLRAIGSDGQQWLAEFQARESERLGVPTLKVGFNKVFGYYIEVTNQHRDRVPPEYVRKQTVKNAERYITDELKKYENEALSAESRANELEYDLFVTLRDHVAERIPALQRAATALAELDVLAGWAELSLRRGYCEPEFVSEPTLEIDAGRHPVVEQTHDNFVPNDTNLDGEARSLGIITGPNMAGKSTYIRQVALLVLLAHCGCWVPAKRMRLGPVDRIFTRVGASDELARGQSTFMVEMLETANILHNATPDSLVILDEVGRGTSTFDGLALAWAIAEQLATRCKCCTLFATHYHEMTELEELLDSVFNLNVAVREFEDQLVFLHQIVPGSADRSYGLHVAKLAGVPRAVIERANAVLNELERTFARESQRPALAAVQRRRVRQLRLFEEPEEAIVRQLRELDLETLGADGAAEFIRKWRDLLGT
ncbi:MAG: DNA mismatch repair protein MutS [Phycisphaerae bacterium]|nr:DNA mismatch repair protein MutS [Phycisphaerae bacterium]